MPGGFCDNLLSMQKIPPALAPALFLPGLLFEALVRARNFSYGAGFLRRHRLPGPVISVGNITMGGSGKTPLVVYIAQMLASRGFRPVILTRGYKRVRSNGTLIVRPGEEFPSAARILGDEPAVIRRHMPSAWMGISKNRFAAGVRIARQVGQPVFILDDGFQHRRLSRDMDIVVLDAGQPLQSNCVFPRGTLREPLRELNRCHVAVINGEQNESGSESAARAFLRHSPKAALFYCSQKISYLLPFDAWNGKKPSDPSRRPRSAFLVAAIGNPDRFLQDVQQTNTGVVGARFFRDHYRLMPEDWRSCAIDARRLNAEAIITTEKDAVKIPHSPDFHLWVAVQSTEIIDAAVFDALLARLVEKRLSERSGAAGRV